MNEDHIKNLKLGDYLISSDNGIYKAIRILAIDELEDPTFHISIFEDLQERPTLNSFATVKPYILHVPVAAIEDKHELLGNIPLTDSDLIGYYEFLKQTDFSTYCNITGQNPDELIDVSNDYFKNAYSLSSQKRYFEAIKEYEKCIEAFPMYYEALDNIAFAYMDLGQYEKALNIFNRSLSINKYNTTALSSIAECLYKLKQYDDAKDAIEYSLSIKNEKISRVIRDAIYEKLTIKKGLIDSLKDFLLDLIQ